MLTERLNTYTMNDQDKLVPVRSYASNIEASMMRDILENGGIPCMLTNETFSVIYPLSNNSIGAVRLLVFERDFNAADAILTNSEQREVTPDSE